MGIFIVCVLLVLCISIDYADDNTTINNIDNATNDFNTSNYIVLNNSSSYYFNGTSGIVKAKSSDKIYTTGKKISEKAKLPIITMTGKPSCGCRYSYTWHTRTYLNYCPNCKHWNCLTNKHKWAARYEHEISCSRCDSDFCICCGKEKMGYSKVYLRKS